MLCTSLPILDVLTRRDPSSPVNSTALWASDWPPKWGLILQYTLMLSEPHENSKYNTFSGSIIKDLVFFQNSVIPTSSIRNSCDQVIKQFKIPSPLWLYHVYIFPCSKHVSDVRCSSLYGFNKVLIDIFLVICHFFSKLLGTHYVFRFKDVIESCFFLIHVSN